MSWRDRFYNSMGSPEFQEKFANILSYSFPFGVWFGARVRLHLWLLLTIFLWFLQVFHDQSLIWITIGVTLLILSLLLHEFGHRFAAEHYRGRHDVFLLWPCGGMIPPPAPPYPFPTFMVHVAGIAVNFTALALSIGLLLPLRHALPHNPFSPTTLLSPAITLGLGPALARGLSLFAVLNLTIIVVNLLPYYWFDGGYLWQAILWPWTGLYQAINVTCIAGMIIAALMAMLMLYGMNLMGVLFWGLLFASAFMKRRELQRTGTGEFDQVIAYSAQMGSDDFVPTQREPRQSAEDRRREKQAAADRAMEIKVDAILDKVREHGIASLSGREQRILQQATERQRHQPQTPRKQRG